MLKENTDPGTFGSEEELTLSGFKDAIADGESTFYYIVVDIAAEPGDTLNATFAGIRILTDNLSMTLAGTAPNGATDTLRYTDAETNDRSDRRGRIGSHPAVDLVAPVLNLAFDLTPMTVEDASAMVTSILAIR